MFIKNHAIVRRLKFPIPPLKNRWWGKAFAFFMGLLFLSAACVLAKSPAGAEMVGDETCSWCHEERSVAFSGNIHARLSVGGDNTCEACHGPGSMHAEEGDPDLIYHPSKDHSITEKNRCNNCHRSGTMDSFGGLAHSEVAEGCGDCHQVHSEKRHLLKKEDPGLCFDCHLDTRAEFRLPSHHPVAEGLIRCYDCHAVHGGTVKFAVDHGDRELCFSCHASKEGPFIFEHEPVNEDCGACHNPHGTVADNLLIQNEPFLCLSCHAMHFHTGLTGFEGDFIAPVHPERGGLSSRDGMKQAFLTKCTQCHSEIHGSDLPAQSISGHGRALTR